MNKLHCVNGCFYYGDMPVRKAFVRVLVRQIARERAEVEMARLSRAFEVIAEKMGW